MVTVAPPKTCKKGGEIRNADYFIHMQRNETIAQEKEIAPKKSTSCGGEREKEDSKCPAI